MREDFQGLEELLISAESAARNNAELCHAVFAAHGQAGTFGSHSWSCRGQAPLFYPNLVTLTQDFSADASSEALLARRDIDILAGSYDGKIQAGCILNRSTDVVGLSNIFHSEAAPNDWLASCMATISRLHPDLPVVGYESGEMLQTMLGSGFQEIGPLRVWLRPETS